MTSVTARALVRVAAFFVPGDKSSGPPVTRLGGWPSRSTNSSMRCCSRPSSCKAPPATQMSTRSRPNALPLCPIWLWRMRSASSWAKLRTRRARWVKRSILLGTVPFPSPTPYRLSSRIKLRNAIAEPGIDCFIFSSGSVERPQPAHGFLQNAEI